MHQPDRYVAAAVAPHNITLAGKTDILWQDTSGNVAMWFMNGAKVRQYVGVGNVPTVWSIQGASAD